MHPESYSFETTPEDARTLIKWKLRLALFYGAVLFAFVIFALTRPHDHVDDAEEAPAKPAFSSASATDHPAR